MKPLESGESGEIKLNINIVTVMDFDILIPLGICVVLPVMIVWLVTRSRQNETNKKTEVMLKAIEAGAPIDANLFQDSVRKRKSVKERLLNRLMMACIASLTGIFVITVGLVKWFVYGNVDGHQILSGILAGGIILAVGLALFIVFFVGRKMLATEMEAEGKSLEDKQ